MQDFLIRLAITRVKENLIRVDQPVLAEALQFTPYTYSTKSKTNQKMLNFPKRT